MSTPSPTKPTPKDLELTEQTTTEILTTNPTTKTPRHNDGQLFLDDSAINDSLKQNLYREPLTHIKNRSPLENILGTCFGDYNAKLTHNQLLPFYKLCDDANILFDAKCTDYDDLFKELWGHITDEPLEKFVNDRWKDFGFQNANPRSDMRGGGLLALKQLVTYAKMNKEKVKEMIKPEHEFLFAVSSINITYYLFRYYHMSDLLVYEKDWKEICSRTALKTFCTILETDGEVFNKIHAMLLEDLFKTWLEIKKAIPNTTLLDFNKATVTIKKRYKRATEKKIFDDFKTLQMYYNKKRSLYMPYESSPQKN